MKKGLTELVFILDRSGSMGGLESDTIGGFNSMLDKQKKGEGEVLVSTVLFDDKAEVLHDRMPMADIAPLTDKEYCVRGCTALLDALGGAIKHISDLHKANRAECPEKTLFIITTDGMENASQKYTYDKVKKMVQKKKDKHNWEFLFLGANIDAVAEAGRFGIAPERAVRFKCDSKGTKLNYEVLNKAVSCYRKVACAEMPNDWKDEIEEDYKNRG